MRVTASATAVSTDPNGKISLTLLVAWTAGDGSQPAGRADVRVAGTGVNVSMLILAPAVSVTRNVALPVPAHGFVNVSVALENCYGASLPVETWVYGARERAVRLVCYSWRQSSPCALRCTSVCIPLCVLA